MVLETRLKTNKISYLVSKILCSQITLKNAHGKKKTNVEKRRTCFKRWILMIKAATGGFCKKSCS